MPVVLNVPADHGGRGIPPPAIPHGFRLSLDVAEPWAGGTVAGRVERSGAPGDRRPLHVALRCVAAWIDIAPQLVGQGSRFSPAMFYELQRRRRGIWLDEVLHEERLEIGPLGDANWLPFSLRVPLGLPRAVEGTFCAFRYTVEASRPRAVGSSLALLPIVIVETPDEPIVRVERTPIGEWRLLEWRAADETPFRAPSVEVRYEQRRVEDLPRPGETRESELFRRLGAAVSPR